MGKETIEGIITVALAIVGVGMIATLVSRNANTAGVITAGGRALATGLTAAEGPVLVSSGGYGFTGAPPIDFPSY